MKFMLDYEHVVVDNPQFFGGPNYRGATIVLIPVQAAHHNEMMSPAVTE